VQEPNLARDERFFVFASTQLQSKKLMVEEKDDESSKWKSSINCRDSETEDAFSSSSRRSCPKWESYTLFQKYDEEMAILDRISAQKLHETGNNHFLIPSALFMSKIIRTYTFCYTLVIQFFRVIKVHSNVSKINVRAYRVQVSDYK